MFRGDKSAKSRNGRRGMKGQKPPITRFANIFIYIADFCAYLKEYMCGVM
jgi:hypothetical protein